MTLYQRLREAGVPLDNHYSDLYVRVTVESTAILKEYGVPKYVFVSQVDGKMWYDVPFAFDPYWTEH